MKTKLALTLLTLATSLTAQEPQRPTQGRPGDIGQGGQKGPPPSREGGGFGGQGGEGFRPPMHPLQQALDTNGDGVIDAKELTNAPAALKKLDKNGDGRLTDDEYRPARPQGGGQGGQGGKGGAPGSKGGAPGGKGGEGGEPRRPEGQPGAGPSPLEKAGADGDFVTRLFQNDKNKDGKLTKDELPEQVQRIVERADANGDGVIDRKEAEAFAERLRSRSTGAPSTDGKRPPLEK